MVKTLDANGASKVFIIGRRKEELQEIAAGAVNKTVVPIQGDVRIKRVSQIMCRPSCLADGLCKRSGCEFAINFSKLQLHISNVYPHGSLTYKVHSPSPFAVAGTTVSPIFLPPALTTFSQSPSGS